MLSGKLQYRGYVTSTLGVTVTRLLEAFVTVTFIMSVLHFLPRLTSWGNLYNKGERGQDYGQGDSDDLISFRNTIGNQREIVPPLNRRKISYWSDNEGDSKYRKDSQRSLITISLDISSCL